MRYLANLLSILIGAVCIIIAFAAFNRVNNRGDIPGHNLEMGFNNNYRQDIEKTQMIGAAAGVVGGIFLIIGFIGFARRRNRKNEPSSSKEVDRLQKQALKFFQ